jgi:hypothetical protein
MIRLHRSRAEWRYSIESTSFRIRCNPSPPGRRASTGSVVSTGGARVTSNGSASKSVSVTSTPPSMAAISTSTGVAPRPYLTMLVNSSSSTRSTFGHSLPSPFSQASVSAVKANSSCSASMRRGKLRRAITLRAPA